MSRSALLVAGLVLGATGAIAQDLVMPNFGSTGLLVSNDDGGTFAMKTQADGLPDGEALRIATSRGFVYALMDSDAGATFTYSVDHGATFGKQAPRFTLIDVAADGVLVALLARDCSPGVACLGLSRNGGATFVFANLPAAIVEPQSVAIGYGVVHVVGAEAYFSSVDYGVTFHQMFTFDQSVETGYSIAAADGSFVYLGTRAKGEHLNSVYASSDGGITFTRELLNGAEIGGQTRVIDVHRGKVMVGTSSGLYVANVGVAFGRPLTSRDGMPSNEVRRVFSSGVEAFVETAGGPWRVVLP